MNPLKEMLPFVDTSMSEVSLDLIMITSAFKAIKLSGLISDILQHTIANFMVSPNMAAMTSYRHFRFGSY